MNWFRTPEVCARRGAASAAGFAAGATDGVSAGSESVLPGSVAIMAVSGCHMEIASLGAGAGAGAVALESTLEVPSQDESPLSSLAASEGAAEGSAGASTAPSSKSAAESWGRQANMSFGAWCAGTIGSSASAINSDASESPEAEAEAE